MRPPYKNYQARAYLNSYNVENARYKSGEVMSVIRAI